MRQTCDRVTDASLRAEKLLAFIKAETRWQLLARPSPKSILDAGLAVDERAALIETWPDIRNRRIPSTFLVSYYDFATDQATRLALLIEIRREREFNRRVTQ